MPDDHSTRLPPNPTRCPLCGGDNCCAAEIERATGQAQPPCWCLTASFDAALLQRIPEQARGQACVCGACLARFRDAQKTLNRL